MSRRGDNIHKRKDGRWEGRYKNGYTSTGGVKYASVYAKTYSECKLKLEKAKFQTINNNKKTENFKFSQVAKLWLGNNDFRLKKTTQMKYQNLLETHILPSLGGLNVAQIDDMTVNSFLDDKFKNGNKKIQKNLSNSYVRTMAVLIEAILKFATLQGYCYPLKNPIHKPTVDKNLPIILTKEDETKMIAALHSEKNLIATGTLIALLTGMRLGEICALQWEDVDFENEVIYIRHSVNRIKGENASPKTKLILDTPKTISSKRIIPISNALMPTLLLAYQSRCSPFVISQNNDFLSPRTFEYKYKSLLKKYNLPIVNFHILRHTFATRCAEAGMDAKTLSLLLGHASSNISLNVYVHPSIESMKNKIDSVYFSYKYGQNYGQKNEKVFL